jgi:hypothetical protein
MWLRRLYVCDSAVVLGVCDLVEEYRRLAHEDLMCDLKTVFMCNTVSV